MFASVAIRKFLFLYLILFTISTAVVGLAYLSYLDYIANLAEQVSNNSIMTNDKFSLKQNLVPLVSGDIVGIKIVNANGLSIFQHVLFPVNWTIFSYKHAVTTNDAILYAVVIQLDLRRPFYLILSLAVIYLFLLIPYNRYENYQKKNIVNALLADVAKKIAHDIRSPLSTLNLLSERIEDVEIKNLQKSVISQINGISEDLLFLNRQKSFDLGTVNPVVSYTNKEVEDSKSYFEVLKSVQSEYMLKRNTLLRNFSFNIPAEINELNAKHEKLIYPIICNVINNGVEATDEYSGHIWLNASVTQKTLVIEIKDNGKGIPADILTQLGKRVISFGKDGSTISGNGLAIFNARKDLEKIGGGFVIESTAESGTVIKIVVPI